MTNHRFQRPRRAARALCCALAMCGAARSPQVEAADARARFAATGSSQSRAHTPGRSATPSELGAAARPAENTGDWGWFVVVPSLAAGAALLGYGLSIDCKAADRGCQERASVTIWGSVGVASLGSVIGISIVERGKAQALTQALAHRSPSLAAPGWQRVRIELAPSPVFQGLMWPTGAVVQLTATLD